MVWGTMMGMILNDGFWLFGGLVFDLGWWLFGVSRLGGRHPLVFPLLEEESEGASAGFDPPMAMVLSIVTLMSSRSLPAAAWVGGLHTSAQRCFDPSIWLLYYYKCRG